MSVFQNIYTQHYEENLAKQGIKKAQTDFNFFDTCLTAVINTFKWQDYPYEKLPAFMIEWFFQNAGRVAMYEDGGNIKIHPCYPAGALTEEGDFDAYQIITPNGKSFVRKAEDIEVGFNNCFKMPYVYKVSQFSDKMSYALRAVDTSLTKACLPSVALFENPEQLKKFERFTDPETAVQPFVGMLKEKLVAKEVEMLDIYHAGDIDVLALWDVYVRYRNLFYTTFGINNVEISKKERLTQAEGSGNDEITRYSLLSDMYECRKDWCDRCNTHFGTDMKFEVNRDITTVFELQTPNDEKLDLAMLDFTKGTNPAQQGEETEEEQNEVDEPIEEVEPNE